MVIIRQHKQMFHRNRLIAALIAGIYRLLYMQDLCDLLLRQVSILPQIPESWKVHRDTLTNIGQHLCCGKLLQNIQQFREGVDLPPRILDLAETVGGIDHGYSRLGAGVGVALGIAHIDGVLQAIAL